ncbi:MAG TPA: response regulator [Dongiaceae bacterium]|nr:response regulator [Dongiaceae bacterium]
MKSILVIDDDPLVGNLMQRMLQSDDWHVRLARDGRDAIAQINDRAPDVIVTDIIMPDMEGLEIISSLHKSHPRIRVIAVSGSGRGQSVDYLAYAEKLGAFATLTKPFRRDELLQAVHRAFDDPEPSGPGV